MGLEQAMLADAKELPILCGISGAVKGDCIQTVPRGFKIINAH